MYAAAANAARSLAQLAKRLDTTPAALAVAFALQNPAVATVLFGATKPAQIEQNVAALALDARLSAADRAELASIGE
jgi:aryl-alcohol dehydrogenase-like predicted oxidoreductase